MSTRNRAIEFYRFLFSLTVCVFHFRTYAPHTQTPHILPFDSGYLSVEFFFLLSGFLLARSAEKKNSLSILQKADASICYLRNRYKRLYPHYLFTVFCMAVIRILGIQNLSVGNWLKKGISEILMLQCIGTGKVLSFVLWFSSATVLASFFIYFLCLWNANVCKILFPFISAAIYSSILQHYDSFNVTFSYRFLFSDGFWRAVAGIMMGCICYEATKFIGNCNIKSRKKLFTVMECLLLTIILIMLYQPHYREKNYTLLLLFAAFIIIIFSQKSYLSDLLDNRLSQYLGKISYAIYLNQIVVYTVFFAYFPADENTSMFWSTIIYLAIVIFLSVITTWLIEKIQNKIATYLNWYQESNRCI